MNKSTDIIGSFAKGLRVFEAFGAETPKLSIAQTAQLTGLDRATARRCLLTLQHEGYAHYDGKYFTLTHRALRLGMGALEALPLPQIVQPWLDQLTEQIGQSCSVAVLDDTEIVYVARAAQKRVMSIGLIPGSRLPAFCTSMGRVLLAGLKTEDTLRRIYASDLTPRTAHSLSNAHDLMSEIEDVRSKGYALVDQEIEIGLRSLAVPIKNSQGKTVAALNTGLAAIQASPDEIVSTYLADLLKVQGALQDIV